MYITLVGHVDHGKSTLGGRILLDTGTISELDILKAKQLALQNKMDSWYLAYLMDTDLGEQQSGKTTLVGYATFKYLDLEHFLLDAPGHKLYVPQMIYALSMADVTIAVVSAVQGEFEASIKGLLKEHITLAKVMGSNNLVIALNKVDLVSQEQLNHIKEEIQSLCQSRGWKNIPIIPISALQGQGISNLLDTVISLPEIDTQHKECMSIAAIDSTKLYGRYPSSWRKGLQLYVYPLHISNATTIEIKEIHKDYIIILNPLDLHLQVGYVLSHVQLLNIEAFTCNMYTTEMLVTGSEYMLHTHSATVPCRISVYDTEHCKIIPFIQSNRKCALIIRPLNPLFVSRRLEDKLNRVALRNTNTIAYGIIDKIKYQK